MRNKYAAAFLAFTLGFLGFHQFYLGKPAKGIMLLMFTIFIKFKLAVFIAVIQGIMLLTKSDKDFDMKYNNGNQDDWNRNRRPNDFQPKTETVVPDNTWSNNWTKNNSSVDLVKEGIAKYKDFDMKGAIESFNKALLLNPYDNAILFNLACCHAHLEQKEAAFDFLTRAVRGGMKDLDKIKTHDGLAFLRVQPEWDEYVLSGYKLKELQFANAE